MQFLNYSITVVYGAVDARLAEEIISFWLSNDAISNPDEASRRVAEVVCVARNAAQEIVGLNSVYVSTLYQPAQAYYFFRTFLRKQDRALGLAIHMVNTCTAHLRLHAADNGINGVVAITENHRLMNESIKRYFLRNGWRHVGRDSLAQDVWHIVDYI